MPKAISIPDLIRRGNGRYSVGQSLYLVVRGGSARFEYRFRDGPALRSLWLGSAVGPAPVTLTAARAARAQAWLDRRSNAPLRRAPARGAGVPFADAVRTYLDHHSNEWSAKRRKQVAALFRLHAAPLDARPVGRITVAEVADCLRPIWTGPGHSQGSNLRGIMERVFRMQNVEPNPAQWSRLENLLSRKAVRVESHPSLPYAQLPAFMVKLATVPTIPARTLRFLVLSGTRAGEAIGATWDEIDLEKKLWTIPKERMKMGEAHTVPLSDAAIALLGKPGTGFVFTATRGAGRLTRSAMNKTLAKFGRTDAQGRSVTVHGFRTTVATWAQENGFTTEVIDLMLAHKERSRTRRAYLRSDRLEDRRKLADAWASYVLGAP